MTTTLEGKDVSLWVETTPKTNYPALDGDTAVYDLVVVGGGITGVMAAYYGQEQGLKVALIDKARLVEWTTGSTTAKLSSQHYLLYNYLIERHGKDVAQKYADANQNGIDEVERLSNTLRIDSEFSRRNAYVYTGDMQKLAMIEKEVAAAQQLGLPASFSKHLDLPVEVAGALQFSNQAQFHPRKFLLGVVDEFVKNGGVVYEHTKARSITPGDSVSIETDRGSMRAKNVLQASGEPFWGGDLFAEHMWMKMSYALAVTLKDPSAYPRDMYITTDQPMRTIRSATYDGKPVMIFGGESHEYDAATYNEALHYQALLDDVHQKYDVDSVLFRWLAGDYMPYDRLPYIGAMPDQPNVYVITGYRAWGLAMAMSATEAIAETIAGTPSEWLRPFGLERLVQPPREADRQKVY